MDTVAHWLFYSSQALCYKAFLFVFTDIIGSLKVRVVSADVLIPNEMMKNQCSYWQNRWWFNHINFTFVWYAKLYFRNALFFQSVIRILFALYYRSKQQIDSCGYVICVFWFIWWYFANCQFSRTDTVYDDYIFHLRLSIFSDNYFAILSFVYSRAYCLYLQTDGRRLESMFGVILLKIRSLFKGT